MTSNPNIKLGELYCNRHSVGMDEFLADCLYRYQAKRNAKPRHIQLSQADAHEREEFDGIRVLFDRETPKNHAFLEVVE